MRNITVDFSQRPPLISDKYAGEIGEHQAVTLNIIPETNMSDDTDIAFYYVLFKVEGGLVASRTFSQGEDISIALWGQLLEDRRLTFQLIGTNGLESIISKSPILTLYLGDSLEGTVIGIDDNRDSLIAMIGAFNERLDDDEEKLSTIQEGAEANVIESIKTADDVTLPISNKTVTLPEAVEVFDRDNYLKYTAFQMREMQSANKQLLFKRQPIAYLYADTTYSYFLVPIYWDTFVVYRINSSSSPYTYFYEYDRYYIVRDKNAEQNKINAIKKADGTTIPIVDSAVTLPNYALVSALADYIEKPSSASDGNALIYNATEEKWDAESRVKNISGMTGNEIRAAWNRGDELKVVANSSLFESKIIKVRNFTTADVPGVIVSYWWSDTLNSVNREYIRSSFIPNTSTTITLLSAFTRFGVTTNEREKLSGGSIASGNGSFVTGGQVYSEGYLKSIPTASTSTLGGVKVDGTSITINDGVISSSGGGSSAPIEINDSEHTGTSLYSASEVNQFLADGKQVLIYGNPVISYDVDLGNLYAVIDISSDGEYVRVYNITNAKVIYANTFYRIPTRGQIISGNTGYATGGDVYTALSSKQDTLTFDSTPTQNSTKPVTSGGLYTVIGNVESVLAELIGGA